MWHVRQVEQIHQTYLKEQVRFEETPVIADLGLSIQSTEGRKRQGATWATILSTAVGFLIKASPKLTSIRTLQEPTQPAQWQTYDENTRLRRCSGVQLLDDFPTPWNY